MTKNSYFLCKVTSSLCNLGLLGFGNLVGLTEQVSIKR